MAVCPVAAGDSIFYNYDAVQAAAVQSSAAPAIALKAVYGNKIELKVTNLSSFGTGTQFKVYVNGSYSKSYSLAALKKTNQINIVDDTKVHLKTSTTYNIRVDAVTGTNTVSSNTLACKTDSASYYNIYKGAVLYNCVGGKMVRSGKVVSAYVIAPCTLCSSRGELSPGKSIAANNARCALVNGGTYKGYYIKVCSTMSRTTQRNYKVKTVVDYAASMNGGRYVWGGASYRATDCSGLTMQAYKKVGIDITHSVRVQATKGKAVSLSNIQAGDVIVCNNYGHVAMYIGNGQIVHAMNSYYGIRIQPISKINYCGRINTIRRIL